MTRYNTPPRFGLSLLLIPFFFGLTPQGSASPDADVYEGTGFTRSLGPARAAVDITIFDADSDGSFELAQVYENGTLTIHDGFFDNDRRVSIQNISVCARAGAGKERLFGVQSGQLVEVTRSGGQGWGASNAGISGLPTLADLRSCDRPGDNALLLIDSLRRQVTVLRLGAALPIDWQYQVPVGAGQIYDAALLDWDGDGADDLAVIDDNGLQVINRAGVELFSKSAFPDGAFLKVLPGSQTPWGHDLLLYHHDATPLQVAVLLAANAFHYEEIYVEPLMLSSVEIADVSNGIGHELILPCGNARCAVVVSQLTVALEALPFLGINYSDVNLMLFDQGEDSTPFWAPAVAVADLDGDMDDDLVFADDLGRGLVVTSEMEDAGLRSARPIQPSPGELAAAPTTSSTGMIEFTQPLHVHEAAVKVEVKVWFQADDASSAPFASVGTQFVSIGTVGDEVTAVISVPAQSQGTGVYYYSFRPILPVDSGEPVCPSWIVAWSPDPEVLDSIRDEDPFLYPWQPNSAEFNDDPNGAEGTVRRPIVTPPFGGPVN